MAYADRHQWVSRELTLNGASDLELLFAPINRITIHKVAMMATNNAAGGAACTFERRQVASTDATIEVVTIPAADHQGDLIYTNIPAGYVLVPGDRINLAVSEGGTAPTAIALIEYSMNDMKLSDGTAAVVIESA